MRRSWYFTKHTDSRCTLTCCVAQDIVALNPVVVFAFCFALPCGHRWSELFKFMLLLLLLLLRFVLLSRVDIVVERHSCVRFRAGVWMCVVCIGVYDCCRVFCRLTMLMFEAGPVAAEQKWPGNGIYTRI